MRPSDVIRYIVWYATQNSIRLTTNRLVKFIYLADLYHARIKGGQTYTNFPWRFVHYGPYCSAALDNIDQLAREGYIAKETCESPYGAKDFHMFSSADDRADDLSRSLNIVVLGQLQRAIKRFGDDTPALLDYVYFNTEPMRDAEKGDLLDFSKAEMQVPAKGVKLKKLSEESVKLGRERIRNLAKEYDSYQRNLVEEARLNEKYKDEVYYQYLEILDGEELEVGLTGVARIKSPT